MNAGPVIGIAGASYTVVRPFGELPVHGIVRWYVDHVIAAGGRPVVLPPVAGHQVLDVLDGLVLAGGGDLDPSLYGADVAARDVDRSRDEAEIALVRAARDAAVPTLGVCRGAQVFAVMDGGTLATDLPHVLPGSSHPISTTPGSLCRSLLGPRMSVNSLHHQAISEHRPRLAGHGPGGRRHRRGGRVGGIALAGSGGPVAPGDGCHGICPLRLAGGAGGWSVGPRGTSSVLVARTANSYDVVPHPSPPGYLSVSSGRMDGCTSSAGRRRSGSPLPSRSRRPPQSGAWDAIAAGRHALVVAPTGSGKTLSAFLWSIDRLATEPVPEKKQRCRVLYVSPLKALAVDVERNLRAPLVGIRQTADRLGVEVPDIRVGVRSGDTTPQDRRRLQTTPPDILITTPESLFLMLTSQARESLRGVETVIVDEVHAVAGTKRGAHLAVSLERLDELLERPAQRIGLSATVRPIDEVARFLGGAAPVEVVAPPSEKEWDLKVVVPVEDMTELGEEGDDGPRADRSGRTSRSACST